MNKYESFGRYFFETFPLFTQSQVTHDTCTPHSEFHMTSSNNKLVFFIKLLPTDL